MAHLHCDACRKRFPIPNPQGWVLSSSESPYYHLAVNMGLETRCGRDTGLFENSSGVLGVEITEYDTQSHSVKGKHPCVTCWGGGWKLRLARRAETHGARLIHA